MFKNFPIFKKEAAFEVVLTDTSCPLHQIDQVIFVKLLAPALALTNLVLDLVNLVTNLAKPSLGQPSHQPEPNLDKMWARL